MLTLSQLLNLADEYYFLALAGKRETPEQREKQNAAVRRHRQKIRELAKTDPAIAEKLRRRRLQEYESLSERLEQDPELYARYLEQQRAAQERFKANRTPEELRQIRQQYSSQETEYKRKMIQSGTLDGLSIKLRQQMAGKTRDLKELSDPMKLNEFTNSILPTLRLFREICVSITPESNFNELVRAIAAGQNVLTLLIGMPGMSQTVTAMLQILQTMADTFTQGKAPEELI
jgi:DNA repair exonuclease SbcCD ATPase subunit